jgi:hypothetical protein
VNCAGIHSCTAHFRNRGATTGGVGGSGPPKFCWDPSNFLDNFFLGGSNLGGVRRPREIALRCVATLCGAVTGYITLVVA